MSIATALWPPLRDDDVGVALARLDELQVHRLHRVQVLVDHRVHRPAALGDVALQPPDEPRVVVGVDEHLDVHQLAQVRVREDQDALDDDGLRGAARCRCLAPGVAREIVHRQFHGVPGAQRVHVADHQVGFERVRVVVVERRPFLEPEVRWSW